MDVIEALAQIQDVSVKFRPDETSVFLRDFKNRLRGQAAAVVLPRTTQAVADCVTLCGRAGIGIYPQGGNTSLCGGSIPPESDGPAIVLNLSHLNAILSLDPLDNSATVQAGCILQQLQAAAASVDRLFPLSLGAEGSCQIGGNIATNAGGTMTVRYGNMRDLVLGLEVVLPDGGIWNGLRSLRKNNSGYDLKNLFIGSEGTLGIVTAATLKLFPRPSHFLTVLFALPSIDHAVDIARTIQAGFPAEVSALEIMSGEEYRIILKHTEGAQNPVATAGDWYLLIELSGRSDETSMSDRLSELLASAFADGSIHDAAIASTERQRQAMWHIRHNVTEANLREGVGLTHDIAVPLAKVPDFIRLAATALGSLQPAAVPLVVGHLGDGNLHYIAMFQRALWQSFPDRAEIARQVARTLHDVAQDLGGTFSAEHGVGSAKIDDMQRYKSHIELGLMFKVKRMLDPANIMNPGRVLPDRPLR